MNNTPAPAKTVLDFFAGIGLVRYALERQGWSEIFALDHSPLKQQIYTHHFGPGIYTLEDIHDTDPARVPNATLAHASFPCTDTSLAGGRQGLAGPQSSALWDFTRVLEAMGERRPPLVLLENVEGFLSSGAGQDITDTLAALNRLGYAVDLMRIDATHFVPQSRVRLFIVGVRGAAAQGILAQEHALQQQTEARPAKITAFIRKNPQILWDVRALPPLPTRTIALDSIIDTEASWWDDERSSYLFSQMHAHHREKALALMAQERWSYGTAFRRMRMRDGAKQSTAEIRLDGIAGCLRTPKGGSARQIVVRMGHGRFDARLLNARENARLMGADDYRIDPALPLNDALFGFGDAVCAPAIEWIAQHAIEPRYQEIAQAQRPQAAAA